MSDATSGARRNRTHAASFALTLLLAPWFAAEQARAANAFDIPAECGTQSEFAREVDARLPPNAPRPAPDVSIERSGSGYSLKLRLAQESREFSHADCRELFRVAVVVTVAMSLSHEAHSQSPGSEGAPATRPVTSAAPPQERVRAGSTERTEPRPHWAFGASAAPGLSFGMAPQPVLQFELEGRALQGMFGLALGLRYRAPGEEQDANNRGVRVSSFGGELAFLARPHRVLEASLGASVYRLFGSGLGAAVAERTDSAWSAGPTLGLMLIPLQRGGTWVGVGGDLHLDLVQPEFQILNYDTVFRVPLFSGSAFLRIGHVFN